MGFLANLLGGGAIRSIGKIIGMFVGNKAQQQSNYHDESMASHQEFASEFQVMNRTWFDSLIDGLNRLPRPTIVSMVIYYFVEAVVDPINFQKINLGLDTVPDMMWQIALAIVAFYFVAREFQKSRQLSLTKKQFDEHMRQVKVLDAMQPQIPPKAYAEQMADESKPLSDAAIREWNRRHNPQ